MGGQETTRVEEVQIPSAGDAVLKGTLSIPVRAQGLILFAHGSSRASPRNRLVAARMQAKGFATLLFDLITTEEEVIDRRNGHYRFDIGLLANRLVTATEWALQKEGARVLPIGYFGASTGAAAALVAACALPGGVAAVVSRGGRPDLAGPYLERVESPTLLIVGGRDRTVIHLNDQAMAEMGRAPKQLVIVPGAGHLFEEPGALERVSDLAGAWFERHLAHDRASEGRRVDGGGARPLEH